MVRMSVSKTEDSSSSLGRPVGDGTSIGRRSDCGSDSCGFKSHSSHAKVALMVERKTENLCVGSSILPLGIGGLVEWFNILDCLSGATGSIPVSVVLLNLGAGTARGGRLFCKEDVQVGSNPTASTMEA